MIKHLALFVVLVGLMTGCQSLQAPAVDKEMTSRVDKQAQESPAATETVAEEASAEPEILTAVAEDQELKQPIEEPKALKRKTDMILMKTSMGDIKLELNKEKAPKTVANFMNYVESGHYAGTIFHRVMDGFMIQAGGFDEQMNQKPAPDTVENEANNGLSNELGSIAMARTSAPHSAGAQFFINVNDNTFLNYPGQDGWGYCVFGKVVEGMDVVEKIEGVRTGNAGPHQNVPKEPIVIHEVIVVEE